MHWANVGTPRERERIFPARTKFLKKLVMKSDNAFVFKESLFVIVGGRHSLPGNSYSKKIKRPAKGGGTTAMHAGNE